MGGHIDCVSILLESHADVHIKDNGGMTAIHGAANFGHADVIELLVRAGCDINSRDKVNDDRHTHSSIGMCLDQALHLKCVVNHTSVSQVARVLRFQYMYSRSSAHQS